MHYAEVLGAQQESLRFCKVCVISCVVGWFFLFLVFEDRVWFYSPVSF